jgi:hypothetical protein
MWERLELFWTAFERFALFFSFVATLAILITMILVYNAVTSIEVPPALTAEDIDPLFDITRQGFEKIQGSVLTTRVSIDHTVPVTFAVRLNPSATELRLVGQNDIIAGAVAIDLRGDAGQLLGEGATLEIGEGNAFNVSMDVSQSIVIDVPVQVEVPVEIPLSSLDLTEIVQELEMANVALLSKAAGLRQEVWAAGQP